MSSTGRPQGAAIDVGGAPGALAITQQGVLVLDTHGGALTRIDPQTRSVTPISHVKGFPASLAVGAGGAWIVDARSGTVTRLRG